jgi:hypothetical protein
MGVILFLIVLCALGFVGFLIYNADTKDDNQGVVLPIKQRFKNADDMQRQFLEAYIWACNVFGVKKNVYDTLYENCVKYPSLGVVYHTYYEVSTSTYSHYPNIPQTNNKVRTWDNVIQQEKFVIEFLGIVNKLRNSIDAEEVKLFTKYNIPFKNLLTREFEVNTMKLFSLPQ